MAAPAGARVYKNPIFTVGGTSYANQVNKARLVPDTPTTSLRLLAPDASVTDVDTPVWTLELAGISDWKNGQGLADYLNDQQNVLVTGVLQTIPGSGEKTATFQFYAHPVDFGGEQGQWLTFDATFGVNGSPVFSDAA